MGLGVYFRDEIENALRASYLAMVSNPACAERYGIGLAYMRGFVAALNAVAQAFGIVPSFAVIEEERQGNE